MIRMATLGHGSKWAIALVCSSIMAMESSAQVTTYNSALGVSGVRIDAVLGLSDGDLFAAGVRNGELHLSRWNAQGDTLWTRGHAIQIEPMPMGFADSPDLRLAKLSTGEIMLTSVTSCYLLNESGDVLSSLGIGGLDSSEHGVDSILNLHTCDIAHGGSYRCRVLEPTIGLSSGSQ